MKEVRLRMRMIKFQEVDEGQGWGWGHVTDHMTMILLRSHDYDIIQVAHDHNITINNSVTKKSE